MKTREPAWRMAEQRSRDKGCLQWRWHSLAGVYGLGYHHNADSRKAGAGYPDVHLWTPRRSGGGGSVYAELKRMGCDPSPAQVSTLGELAAAGHPVYLGRPCCLLVGAVDELMAELAGVRCRYAEGSPAGPLFPFPPAPVLSPPGDLEGPAGGDAPVPGPGRPRFRRPPPPGADPVEFAPAVGYVIPTPADDPADIAVLEVERWLRTAGFSAVNVPYPLRLVTGAGIVHAHCRVGLARQGTDVRVWRQGTPAAAFPHDLVEALHAVVVNGASSTAVTEAVTAAFELPRRTQNPTASHVFSEPVTTDTPPD